MLYPTLNQVERQYFFDRMEIDVWLLKNKHSQVKDDGGLIGNEWQENIPDYWKDFKPVNYMKDE